MIAEAWAIGHIFNLALARSIFSVLPSHSFRYLGSTGTKTTKSGCQAPAASPLSPGAIDATLVFCSMFALLWLAEDGRLLDLLRVYLVYVV